MKIFNSGTLLTCMETETKPTFWGGITLKVVYRIAMITLLAALTLQVAAGSATANPALAERREEARRVKAQLDELDRQLALAAEDHNEAAEKHADVTQKINETRSELEKTNARISVLEDYLSASAEAMYRRGPLQFVEVLLSTQDLEEFTSTWMMLEEMNREEAENVGSLKEARAKAERYEAELVVQEAAAAEALSVMAARRASAEGKLADRRRMLQGIEDEIAAIERADRARAEAELRTASTRRSQPRDRNFPAPTRAARSEVVNIAKRYLGTPYKWGGNGPNSFDCSGFTRYVFRQVGVNLPRVSRQQINVGQRVSRQDLQPGDLVFFGRPIHHVGIYVGGGRYIHSPRTGDVVSIDPMTRRDFAGATRP